MHVDVICFMTPLDVHFMFFDKLQKEMAQRFTLVALLSGTLCVKIFVRHIVSQRTHLQINVFVLYHAPPVLVCFGMYWKNCLISAFLPLEAGYVLNLS